MVALIEADHVFRPQPHERVGRKVVPDDDRGRFHWDGLAMAGRHQVQGAVWSNFLNY